MVKGLLWRESSQRTLQGLSWRLLQGMMSTESAAAKAEHVAASKKKLAGKRFYEKANMRPADKGGGYEVLLDHRVLRTPAKKALRLPTPALALALAAEWEWQDRSGVRSFTMPLVRLASITIDQIPIDKEKIIASLLKYCHTDALCCRAEPGSKLADKQTRYWDPLLDWAEKELGARLIVSSSIFGANQPQHVLNALEKTLRNLNDWELAAVDSLASSSRSLVVALAVARNHLKIDQALDIIRLEEEHQIDEWGLVEGGHDIDIADLRVRISAASIFLRLLGYNTDKKL
ncbi:hypothetical protein R1flu_006606 [Riccia fluitans]|uniref:ATP synthase mitochondrial F1 complex assembly factor 2 n=1 Tax=Riccia fluitans TaxID=41844 RepID=A0ABD1YZI5_9MARC